MDVNHGAAKKVADFFVRGDSDGPRFSRPDRARVGLAFRAAGTSQRRGKTPWSTTMPDNYDREDEEAFYDAYTELLDAEDIDLDEYLADNCE